ncbi:MAG TPA: alkaline phosphatase family protein [Myxococcales bacterium]|nr:alkaline phosphatase family protein [Myxococcales bacterium]
MLEGARSRLVQGLVRHLLRPVAGGGRQARAPLPSGRRMLLLHLDGVGRAQLEHALEHGYAPTLRAMLERGPYRLSPCRSGAPTSTPAFQAGLLYGVGHDIPGYTWFDKRRGSEVRMDRGEDARLLEEELARSGNPLLRGGSVYCSIFSGGALSRRWALSGWNEELCAEDFGMEELSRAPLLPQARDVAAAAMVHSATAGRIAGALGLDVASGLVETARWVRHVGSLQHEPKFLFHRVLTECLFAEFAANSCVIDIARGIPIIYACFIGYDEYAHRRGPFSRMALLKLWELDRMLGRIFAATAALPELNYEMYLFSDHGQVATRPAELVLGESLGEHLLADGRTAGSETVAFGGAGGGEAAAVAARARWLRRVSAALPGALGKATLAWARHVAKGLDAAHPARADGPLLVVPAGDIAHVYSTCVASPLRESEIRARHPGLLERCARSPAVGFTLLRGDKGPLALRGDRRLDLDRPQDALAMAHEIGHPLAAVYARDLLAMRSAGDVVLLGTAAPCGATVAFPFEFGSHGGLAPGQLDTFMIHPQELGEGAFASVVRPPDLHRFFLERSGRLSRELPEPREEATCAS